MYVFYFFQYILFFSESNSSVKSSDLKLEDEMVSYQLTPPILADLIPKLPLEVYYYLEKIYEDPLVRNILLNGAG